MLARSLLRDLINKNLAANISKSKKICALLLRNRQPPREGGRRGVARIAGADGPFRGTLDASAEPKARSASSMLPIALPEPRPRESEAVG